MGGVIGGLPGLVLDAGSTETGENGPERSRGASGDREPDGGLLLGGGQRQGERSPAAPATSGDGSAVEGKSVGPRSGTGRTGRGAEEGGLGRGACVRGTVPEIEFLHRRTQRPVVVVPPRPDPTERQEASGADGDP